ncbi:ParA family protein [Pontixanthobacter sp.]|uniref:ParA family protein n=1 Tax=Pontixanthobacter sp. TaxID=2792078 RepID=UPI003C7C7805
MATVAVYSVKGGVGKTTLAANLAWCSAAISCRETLLWDLDASGGAAFLLGVDPKKKKRVTSVFSQEYDPHRLIRATGHSRLDVLPADESIRALDRQLMKIGKRKRLAKLGAGLSKKYDRIVLDCPPVLNELSAQIMRACDLVIVPLPPSPLSTRAFDLVAQEVKSAIQPHPPILPVLSMIDMRRTLHREARAQASDWPVIPLASAAEQCAVRQQPVGVFAPRSPSAQSFAQLWTAIERKLAALKK